MSADAELVGHRPRRSARGPHGRRWRDEEELEGDRGGRERSRRGEPEEAPGRGREAPRRRGKHGCDRIRGQGMRRRID